MVRPPPCCCGGLHLARVPDRMSERVCRMRHDVRVVVAEQRREHRHRSWQTSRSHVLDRLTHSDGLHCQLGPPWGPACCKLIAPGPAAPAPQQAARRGASFGPLSAAARCWWQPRDPSAYAAPTRTTSEVLVLRRVASSVSDTTAEALSCSDGSAQPCPRCQDSTDSQTATCR